MIVHRAHGAFLLLFVAATPPAYADDGQLSGHNAQTPSHTAATIEGLWHEVTPTACQQAKGDTAAEPVRELKFDGAKFFVIWMPFETYVDYWGTHTYDAATGALSFTVAGGNHVPPDARLTGAAHIDPDGKLQITGIFFGTPGNGAAHAHTSDCPAVFKH